MSLLKMPFGETRQGKSAAGRPADLRLAGVNVSAAHHIRLGLTGLGAIFLFVMVAAAGMHPSPSVAVAEPAESLAVLGVAPGASPAAAAQETRAAASARAPRPT